MRRQESLLELRHTFENARIALLRVVAIAMFSLGAYYLVPGNEGDTSQPATHAGPTTTVTHPPFVPRDGVLNVVNTR